MIISANGRSKAQTTAHLTLNPPIPIPIPIPITYFSIQYNDNPQIITFPSGNLLLTLTNISAETQTLSFTPPSNWTGVSYIGCTSPLAPGMTCTLTFSPSHANYAGLFAINAVSPSGYMSTILVPVAFADTDNNLVYSVNPASSTYNAVNINNVSLISPNNSGYQWCSTSLSNPCLITTGATNLYNGSSNTSSIIETFAALGVNPNTYAAGYCSTLSGGSLGLYYYLPAICELGDNLQGVGLIQIPIIFTAI